MGVKVTTWVLCHILEFIHQYCRFLLLLPEAFSLASVTEYLGTELNPHVPENVFISPSLINADLLGRGGILGS